MRTIWSPSSWRSDERATWTMPSGDQAWDPSASFSAGTPKSTRAGTPAPESRRASFTNDSTVCWTTPGSDTTGCGMSMPSRTKRGATKSFTVSLVSASISRSTAERRRRRIRVSGKPIALYVIPRRDIPSSSPRRPLAG